MDWCKLSAPSPDTGSKEEVLLSLTYKAVNISNIATERMSLKK